MTAPKNIVDKPTVKLPPNANQAGRADTDPSTTDSVLTETESLSLPARTQLGRYVVIHQLGSGGMGVVYLAHDPELDRNVAVKVLRETPNTSEDGQARLMREAQAMARLSHPNVVNVYDVGLSPLGVYIAMEFIDGKTLREWVRSDHPSPAEILEVCIGAGRGVAAAHRAGFVHRDLKPGNILVALRSGSRPPKGMVVDFGLARSATPSTSESGEITVPERTPIESISTESRSDILESPLTQQGFVVGTPAYMAPEQRNGALPSPATDQFSFCVTVFEVLFGHRPSQSPAGTRASDLHWSEATTGDPRLCDRARHVLARGLQARPEKRFDSMSALLQALTRALAPSTYRVWYGALGLAVVGATTVAWAASQSTPDDLAQARCSGAQQRLAGVWDAPAKQQLATVFATIPEKFATESWSRVEQHLDTYAATWTAAYTDACSATHVLGEQPQSHLDVRMRCLESRRAQLAATANALLETSSKTIKRAVSQVGALDSLARCNDVEALLAEIEPPTDPRKAQRVDRLRARIQQAEAWRNAGKFDRAEQVASSVAETARTLDYPPIEAEAMASLAEIQYGLRQVETAMKSWTQAHTLAAQAGHDVLAAEIATHLVATLSEEHTRFDEAMQWSRHARAAIDRHDHADGYRIRLTEAQLHNNMGVMFAIRGEHHRAHEYYYKALETKRELLGEPHVEIASILQNIALGESEFGHTEKSIRLLEESIEMHRETLGQHHPYLMPPLSGLAGVLMLDGQLDPAEVLYAEVLEIGESSGGLDHPVAIQALSASGYIAAQRGQYDRAIELGVQALERALTVFPPGAYQIGAFHAQLAKLYGDKSDFENAYRHYEESFKIARSALGKAHPDVAIVEAGLGATLVSLGRFEEAKVHLEHAAENRRAALGDDHIEVGRSYSSLAQLYFEQKSFEQALQLHQRALRIFVKAGGEAHPNARLTLSSIGLVLLELDRPADAVDVFQRSLAPTDGVGENSRNNTAVAQFGLAQALVRSGGDRKRALDLSAQSLAFFEASGAGFEAQAAQIAKWRTQQ